MVRQRPYIQSLTDDTDIMGLSFNDLLDNKFRRSTGRSTNTGTCNSYEYLGEDGVTRAEAAVVSTNVIKEGSNLVLYSCIGGAVLLVGILAFFLLRGSKEEEAPPEKAALPVGEEGV